jgi:hypothetical protein
LREFKFHKKIIVFTREMERKVFGIQCGNCLVMQKKGEHPELRQMYIEERQSRPFIQHVVNLLKNCDGTESSQEAEFLAPEVWALSHEEEREHRLTMWHLAAHEADELASLPWRGMKRRI